MKKILVLFSFLLFAQAAFASNYSNMCPLKPYPVSNKFAQGLSKISGANLLMTTVAEGQIKKELKKDFKADFDVQLVPFGSKNLLDGKFKSFGISAPQVAFMGMSISDFSADTVCGYNHIVMKKNDVLFAQNFVMKYSAAMDSDDIQNLLKSGDFVSTLNKMDVKIANKTIFKIYDPNAEIVNDKIRLSFKVLTPLFFSSTETTATMNAGLAVKDEKIVLSQVDFGTPDSNVDLSKLVPLFNRLNVMSYCFKISKSTSGTVKVSDVKILGGKISVSGFFIVPKNV